MILGRPAERRAHLKRSFVPNTSFQTLEESCVPSYAHKNPFAAWVAWRRLEIAAKLFQELAPSGPVCDFGSGTGEIFHLLGEPPSYFFIEENEYLVGALNREIPKAERVTLDTVPKDFFGTVFALDSLEHNDDVALILSQLIESIRSDGVFILSGPTENLLYRIGRRIAGFSGHYHKTTILDIEELVAKKLKLLKSHRVPCGIPLFHLSAWKIC